MDRMLRILLVEDQPLDAELLERELRRQGLQFSLQRVTTRESFSDALATFDPDVILSDSNLPDFSGHEALEITKQLAPEKPFIVLSGMTDEDRKTEALQRGAADYVDKSRQDRIVTTIARALEANKKR